MPSRCMPSYCLLAMIANGLGPGRPGVGIRGSGTQGEFDDV
jgi:hypothetical protein